MLTQSDRNQIFDLLKQVTEVIEDRQSSIPEDEPDENWLQLASLIEQVDGLYCDIEDMA